MNTVVARERYRVQFDQFEQFALAAPRLAGARLPWLRRARGRAIERFAEVGLPTTRDEDWKYTSVAALARQGFEVAAEPAEAFEAFAAGAPDDAEREAAGWLADFALPGCAHLVFVNGYHVPAWSDLGPLGALPAGVTVGSLGAELSTRPERVEAWIGDAADLPGNGFAALNAALWTDGAVVEVGAGVALAAPLQLLYITTRGGLAAHPRNRIELSEGARAEIVEHHVGPNDAGYLTNAYTEIVLDRGAALTHSKLQQEGRRAFHVADIRAAQAQDSRFTSHAFAFGGLLSRADIATRFDAEGCSATLLGLYLADGRQHMDHHTRIEHASPRGLSRQLYKGVLDGAARAVFNGKVIVSANAQQSDAEQSNRNLLLSEQAEVDTKPQLEIFADDVKCSHGATVGQLDPEQLHYLRSRGIDAGAARALLIHAFASEVVARVDIAPLRECLDGLLRQRLPAGREDAS